MMNGSTHRHSLSLDYSSTNGQWCRSISLRKGTTSSTGVVTKVALKFALGGALGKEVYMTMYRCRRGKQPTKYAFFMPYVTGRRVSLTMCIFLAVSFTNNNQWSNSGFSIESSLGRKSCCRRPWSRPFPNTEEFPLYLQKVIISSFYKRLNFIPYHWTNYFSSVQPRR